MSGRPPRSTSLAAVHEASKTPDRGTQLHPLLAPAAPAFEATEELDQHDLLVGIAVGLKFTFLLGNAFKATAEAQATSGPARLAKIEEAMRYLAQARAQEARR